MNISDEAFENLRKLSGFYFSEEEKDTLKIDLDTTIEYMSNISGLDTKDTEPFIYAVDEKNAFREDHPLPSIKRELILKNAPKSNDEFFLAPKAVDTGGGNE